jgi:hypothetical protein
VATDLIFLSALLAACVVALRDRRGTDRAVWALLALHAATNAALILGAAFNPWLWMACDAVAAIAILLRPPHQWGLSRALRDLAIVALFVAAWPFYFRNDQFASDATDVICAAQLLLALPLTRAWRRARDSAPAAADPWADFDLRARA